MATLDFGELNSKPAGETFEGLVRLIGERLGLTVSWSGRGADQGRDLLFVETQCGQIGSSPIRWLVSCKDNSKTNQAVTEHDVGSVIDKVRQHGCDAFLLATTTTVGTALKTKLDELSNGKQERIQTKVWDRFELTKMLLSDRCTDLLRQFFPKQSARSAVIELDAAREKIEAAVPRQVVGSLRSHLVPLSERYASLRGATVWPHDIDQQKIIDQICQMIVGAKSPTSITLQKWDALEFDAFLALTDRLIRNFPIIAYEHLLAYAKKTKENGKIFNLVQILREFDQFSDELEYEITARCDSETLWELYEDVITEGLTDAIYWGHRVPAEVERFHEEIEIIGIDVDDLQFSGGLAVNFSAVVRFDVKGSTDEGEYGCSSSRDWFSYQVSGYPMGSRIEIEKIKFLR